MRHMRPVRGSEDSPLRLDRVVDVPGSAGWLALTLAPGKKTWGTEVRWDRDLELDLDRLVELGATTLAPLITDRELVWLQIPELPSAAGERGLDVVRFPFDDGSAPASMTEAAAFVDELCRRVGRGERVVVHCNGGLGRAGTIGACVRLRLGLDGHAQAAVAAIRRLRGPRAIETPEQERFIASFARLHADAARADGDVR